VAAELLHAFPLLFSFPFDIKSAPNSSQESSRSMDSDSFLVSNLCIDSDLCFDVGSMTLYACFISRVGAPIAEEGLVIGDVFDLALSENVNSDISILNLEPGLRLGLEL
jgi:hypothetical protein